MRLVLVSFLPEVARCAARSTKDCLEKGLSAPRARARALLVLARATTPVKMFNEVFFYTIRVRSAFFSGVVSLPFSSLL